MTVQLSITVPDYRKESHVEFFVGYDLEGDACLYAQWVDGEGESRGYLNDSHLVDIAAQLNDALIAERRRV